MFCARLLLCLLPCYSLQAVHPDCGEMTSDYLILTVMYTLCTNTHSRLFFAPLPPFWLFSISSLCLPSKGQEAATGRVCVCARARFCLQVPQVAKAQTLGMNSSAPVPFCMCVWKSAWHREPNYRLSDLILQVFYLSAKHSFCHSRPIPGLTSITLRDARAKTKSRPIMCTCVHVRTDRCGFHGPFWRIGSGSYHCLGGGRPARSLHLSATALCVLVWEGARASAFVTFRVLGCQMLWHGGGREQLSLWADGFDIGHHGKVNRSECCVILILNETLVWQWIWKALMPFLSHIHACWHFQGCRF